MRILIALALITASSPVLDIPVQARQSNWLSNGSGSCVHASFVSLLQWQGRTNTANYWRATYGGGESPDRFSATLNAENIRFAQTTEGDEQFLEWSIRTRRGCNVTVNGGVHMVTLVGLTSSEAVLLDNNNVTHLIRLPRSAFLTEWRNSHGWAVAPVYTPAAPAPIYSE